jgi:hypothetical protein
VLALDRRHDCRGEKFFAFSGRYEIEINKKKTPKEFNRHNPLQSESIIHNS